MYTWVVFLHVLAAFGFFLAHGASATVMLRVRGERDRARIHALLDLSNAAGGAMTVTFLLLLLMGIVAGFMRRWWGHGWIWVSLALLIALSIVMSLLGRLYFDRVRRAIGIATDDDRRKKLAPPLPVSPEELAVVLASGRPMALTVIGIGGLAVIVWLMMFKPF